MSSWSEIERIRKDADVFRGIARSLLVASSEALTDWEIDFLENLAGKDDGEELSSRQAEILVQIRDNNQWVETHKGWQIRILLRQCYEARLDLIEDDEEWIAAVYLISDRSVRRRQIGRLFRCARSLHIIEDDPLAA